MNAFVSNGSIVPETRAGWQLQCPACDSSVLYTVLNISGGIEPFMYCDRSSDFVLRNDDMDEVIRRVGDGAIPTVEQLRDVYDDLEAILQPCPTGGSFRRWSNARCPHCRFEFPYLNGVQSENVRYFESRIVWIEGAVAYRGSQEPSNRLERVLL